MQPAEFIHQFHINATIALVGVGFILLFLAYVMGQLICVTIRQYIQDRHETRNRTSATTCHVATTVIPDHLNPGELPCL